MRSKKEIENRIRLCRKYHKECIYEIEMLEAERTMSEIIILQWVLDTKKEKKK